MELANPRVSPEAVHFNILSEEEKSQVLTVLGISFENTRKAIKDLTSTLSRDNYVRAKVQYRNMVGISQNYNSIDAFNKDVTVLFTKINKSVEKNLKPISTFTGGTIASGKNLILNPVDTICEIPNSIGLMMDKKNPNFRRKLLASIKKHKLEHVTKLPSKIYGSLKHIYDIINNIVSIPIGIINDLYNGLQELITSAQKLIQNIFSQLEEFFQTIIESLFPGITELLDAVQDFTNEVMAVASLISPSNILTGTGLQILTSIQQINFALVNPVSFATSFVTNNVSGNSPYSQFISYANNPQLLINQFIPIDLSNAFGKITAITGFGLNGRMGYGLGSVVQQLLPDIQGELLAGVRTQFPIITNIVTGNSFFKTEKQTEQTTTEVLVPTQIFY